MSDDKVKDIFTKKSLKDVEIENEIIEKEYQDELRSKLQEVIDKQQELLDSGDLTGLMFCGTTKDGYVMPYYHYVTHADALKMNFLSDTFKESCIATCLYGVNGYPEDDIDI